MAGLRIGDRVTLPLDFATEAWAILARRGAGKSNAGAVVAEELHRNGLPFVVVDPKGDWWGIRSSADGKQAGLPVPVFGGRHGDVPLEAGAGNLIADLILGDQTSYLSCVLDVSQFSLSEQRRFLTDFGDRLFRRKDEQGVLTLIFEEAHEYLPQSVPRDSAKLVSIYQRIVKQGRQRGLGVGMLSQRSAALNKDVLTQVGALFPMWTMSPQDRAAIKAWVEVGGEANDLINSLHQLKPGEAWIWWPEGYADQQRFTFRRRWTFDSGATPKAGTKRVMPRTLADVDLGEIKEAMAETIEKAKAADPKELQKRIRELTQEIDRMATQALPVERVEVPVLTENDRKVIWTAIERLDAAVGSSKEMSLTLGDALGRVLKASETGTHRRSVVTRDQLASRPSTPPTADRSTRQAPRSAPTSDDQPKLGKTERTILSVLVQHGAMDNAKLALLSGYSAKASTVGVALGKLRRWELVEPGQPVRATAQGVAAVEHDLEPLPSGGELIDYWRHRFGKTERAVLDVLIEMHPNSGTYASVAEAAGYSPTASTVGVALGKLRRVGVVEGWNLSDDFVSATGL